MAEQFVSVNDLLKKFGGEFVKALGNSLDKTKDASGDLRKSIRFQIKIFSEYYSFNILMKDYYEWVDAGRKPGKGIPPDELMKWLSISRVRAKLNKKPDSIFRKPTKPYQVKGLAYIINRKIKKFGIKPTYFFTDVFEDGRVQQLKRDLSIALKKDVLVTIKNI